MITAASPIVITYTRTIWSDIAGGCETKEHKRASERWIRGEASIEFLFVAITFERVIRNVLARDVMRMRDKDPTQTKLFLDQPWRISRHCIKSDFLRVADSLSSMSIEERTGHVAAQVHHISQWRELRNGFLISSVGSNLKRTRGRRKSKQPPCPAYGICQYLQRSRRMAYPFG